MESPNAVARAPRPFLLSQVTILENLEVEDAPCVSKGGGICLSVPRNSLRCGIGPITVEETAEVVNSDDEFVFVVMQVVHCLPAPCSFKTPLTLDFVVRDGRVSWWNRAAVRKEVLREYKVRYWSILKLPLVQLLFTLVD